MARKVFNKNASNSQDEVALPKVESYLVTTFRPVKPRPDFVDHLRSRLTAPSHLQPSRASAFYFLALIVLVISSITLIIAGMVRLLVEFLSKIRMKMLNVRQSKNPSFFAATQNPHYR